jgi:CBS domain-containing protein
LALSLPKPRNNSKISDGKTNATTRPFIRGSCLTSFGIEVGARNRAGRAGRLSDLAEKIRQRRIAMKTAEVMTRNVVTVSPQLPLADAVRLMLEHRVSGLPVVDGAGHLVGLLTSGDLLRRFETGTDSREGWFQALLVRGRMAEQYVHTHGRRVRNVMTHDVATVDENSSLVDVVEIMESRHVRRVPVVRRASVIECDRLVGIVSRSDLVRALGAVLDQASASDQPDHTIRDCILTEIARHRWTPGENIQITVNNGVVELQGDIFDERMRDAMRVIAEGVLGVKAVEDKLLLVDPNSVFIGGV